MIDEKDRLLLSYLQKGLPIQSRPFIPFGAKIGLDTADVLLRIERLRQGDFLSGIRAVWEPKAFCYQGAWAAMSFPEGELGLKAEIIGKHPGVIYSAERDHDLNFWFFITVPASHDLEAHVRVLEKQTAPEKSVLFPLRRSIKGGSFLQALDGEIYEGAVELPLNPGEAGSLQGVARPGLSRVGGLSLDETRVARVMQEDLPITDEPFRRFAESLGMPEEQFLGVLDGLVRKGYLKRIGAHLIKKRPASRPKMIVAWQIPGEKLDKAAVEFLEFPEIIYADARECCPGFPYSVSTVVQFENEIELEALVRRIEDRIGKWPSRTVRTVREIKKTALKYFPKELDAWWVRNRALADEALQRSM
jgi:DNA-binding Lrp family transcriptional regulator